MLKKPFQHIINQISKLHAIIDPNHEIEFPDIPEKDLQNILKVTSVVHGLKGMF
jgi:serine/threonine-protein kinase TTK/MPS1